MLETPRYRRYRAKLPSFRAKPPSFPYKATVVPAQAGTHNPPFPSIRHVRVCDDFPNMAVFALEIKPSPVMQVIDLAIRA